MAMAWNLETKEPKKRLENHKWRVTTHWTHVEKYRAIPRLLTSKRKPRRTWGTLNYGSQIWCNQKTMWWRKRLAFGDCFSGASLKGIQFGEFCCLWKQKSQRIQFVKGQKLCRLRVLHLVFNFRQRTMDYALRSKQWPAEEISGLHGLKARSLWRIFVLLFKIFDSENRIDYNLLSSKTLCSFNLLSKLTILDRRRPPDFSKGSIEQYLIHTFYF